MYEKSNMETYITICKIDSQQEFAVWLRKLKQALCINLEGWDGEGVDNQHELYDGRGVPLPIYYCIATFRYQPHHSLRIVSNLSRFVNPLF